MYSSLILFLSTILFVCFVSSKKSNCSCDPDLCSAVMSHDYVLEGKVKSVTTANNVVNYSVSVVDNYKGKTQSKIYVLAQQNDPCLMQLKKKETYLLFLSLQNNEYWLSGCYNNLSSSLSSKDMKTVQNCSTPVCGPVCEIFCPYGNVMDKNGCPTCECNPCPNGTMPNTCLFEPCSQQSIDCPQAHSCMDNYCGGCYAHYFDVNGNEICKTCPGLLCAIACEWGYKKDPVTGCPICSCESPPANCANGKPPTCNSNPCEAQPSKCPGAAFCVPDYCNQAGCTANFYDWHGNTFDCSHPPCEDMMCSLFCEWGFTADANKCPQCACNSKPVCSNGKKPVACQTNPCSEQRNICPNAHSCLVDNCQNGCSARYYNSTGAEICMGCEPITCEIACANGFATNPNTGCLECSCKPECASAPPCAIVCPNGYYRDDNGCPICKCLPSRK